ncbi:hypothetical protein SKAU_G00139150 [Synaphobranchus kaupii]|uniref:Uncharacterized protein n=1 Tax=Synaphobranchus kaupii TaxID=118154 RepID=A0A9Q1FSB9_SYNKA|nr:hypothetical protein SKAU_G00139150 [Synaphobranchus kaupii]
MNQARSAMKLKSSRVDRLLYLHGALKGTTASPAPSLPGSPNRRAPLPCSLRPSCCPVSRHLHGPRRAPRGTRVGTAPAQRASAQRPPGERDVWEGG